MPDVPAGPRQDLSSQLSVKERWAEGVGLSCPTTPTPPRQDAWGTMSQGSVGKDLAWMRAILYMSPRTQPKANTCRRFHELEWEVNGTL